MNGAVFYRWEGAAPPELERRGGGVPCVTHGRFPARWKELSATKGKEAGVKGF